MTGVPPSGGGPTYAGALRRRPARAFTPYWRRGSRGSLRVRTTPANGGGRAPMLSTVAAGTGPAVTCAAAAGDRPGRRPGTRRLRLGCFRRAVRRDFARDLRAGSPAP